MKWIFLSLFALAYAHPNGFDQPCKPGEHCPRHKDPTCPPGKPCPRQNPEPSPRIPDDKLPQPLVKHLSSVDVAGKYDDSEGKQAA